MKFNNSEERFSIFVYLLVACIFSGFDCLLSTLISSIRKANNFFPKIIFSFKASLSSDL
jgi:HKD family nuclease